MNDFQETILFSDFILKRNIEEKITEPVAKEAQFLVDNPDFTDARNIKTEEGLEIQVMRHPDDKNCIVFNLMSNAVDYMAVYDTRKGTGAMLVRYINNLLFGFFKLDEAYIFARHALEGYKGNIFNVEIVLGNKYTYTVDARMLIIDWGCPDVRVRYKKEINYESSEHHKSFVTEFIRVSRCTEIDVAYAIAEDYVNREYFRRTMLTGNTLEKGKGDNDTN